MTKKSSKTLIPKPVKKEKKPSVKRLGSTPFPLSILPNSNNNEGTPNTDNDIEEDAVKVLQKIRPPISNSTLSSKKFKAWNVPRDNADFQLISKYIKNSNPHGFNMEIKNILKLDRFLDNVEVTESGLRMMLWHGTRSDLVEKILLQGFLKSEKTTLTFGRGIYFSDRASKSFKFTVDQECTEDLQDENIDKWMLLCEVNVGNFYEAKDEKHSYTKAPTFSTRDGGSISYDSVKGIGKNVPESTEEVNGCMWPTGITEPNLNYPANITYNLTYNEYVVYETNKIKLKFLVQL